MNTSRRYGIPITASDEPKVQEALSATPDEVFSWHDAIEAELKEVEH